MAGDATYEIEPYKLQRVPDGGRWLLVYHDGDEESYVRYDRLDGLPFFRLGPTSGDWLVASDGAANPEIPVAARVQ